MFLLLIVTFTANAQRPEVTISLNEAFFDALLDSVFSNFEPPEFSLATTRAEGDLASIFDPGIGSSFDRGSLPMRASGITPVCPESIKILREMRGVKTAVRFRDGKVVVPLAFSGNYAPPLIGCVEFAGWAESNLDLEFDQDGQRLIGRIRVNSVNLNGTGGIGGSVIAKLIQGSIDKKMNPVEVLSLDKVSFGVPLQRSGTLKMRAYRIRPEVGSGVLNVRVEYDFVKG